MGTHIGKHLTVDYRRNRRHCKHAGVFTRVRIFALWHGKRAAPNSPVKIQIRVSIPKTFRITAQNNPGYFFVRNEQLWQLPGPDDAGVYLFDYSACQGFTNRYQYAECFNGLLADPQYAAAT